LLLGVHGADEIVRPRQAAGVGGEEAIGAAGHGGILTALVGWAKAHANTRSSLPTLERVLPTLERVRRAHHDRAGPEDGGHGAQARAFAHPTRVSVNLCAGVRRRRRCRWRGARSKLWARPWRWRPWPGAAPARRSCSRAAPPARRCRRGARDRAVRTSPG